MSIIEREIKRREDFINQRAEELEKAERMSAEAVAIKQKWENINIDTLRAEIEELRAFLPRPEEV